MSESKYNDILQRFKRAKENKKERIDAIVADMKERYERETGLKANYVEVW